MLWNNGQYQLGILRIETQESRIQVKPTEHSGKGKELGTYRGRRAQRCPSLSGENYNWLWQKKGNICPWGVGCLRARVWCVSWASGKCADTLEASIKTINGQGADPLGAETCATALYSRPLVHSEALLARLVRSWFRLIMQIESHCHQKTKAFAFPKCRIVPSQCLTSCSPCKHCEWGWWAGWLGVGFTSRVTFLFCKDSMNWTRTVIFNSSESGAALVITLTRFPTHPTTLLFSIGEIFWLGRD